MVRLIDVVCVGLTVIVFENAVLAIPDLYAVKLTVKVPAELNATTTVLCEVEVDGAPPFIVHRTESGEPVELLVNVSELPLQTTD